MVVDKGILYIESLSRKVFILNSSSESVGLLSKDQKSTKMWQRPRRVDCPVPIVPSTITLFVIYLFRDLSESGSRFHLFISHVRCHYLQL